MPVCTVCMSLSCVLNLVQSVFVLQATLSIFHVKRLSCKEAVWDAEDQAVAVVTNNDALCFSNEMVYCMKHVMHERDS